MESEIKTTLAFRPWWQQPCQESSAQGSCAGAEPAGHRRHPRRAPGGEADTDPLVKRHQAQPRRSGDLLGEEQSPTTPLLPLLQQTAGTQMPSQDAGFQTELNHLPEAKHFAVEKSISPFILAEEGVTPGRTRFTFAVEPVLGESCGSPGWGCGAEGNFPRSGLASGGWQPNLCLFPQPGKS